MKKAIATATAFFFPLLALAQVNTVFDAGNLAISIINTLLVPLVFAIAFIVFIWGVFQYFIAGDEEKRKQGTQLMLYGIVGFFVMVSVWGLVNILVNTLNLNQNQPRLPQTPGLR